MRTVAIIQARLGSSRLPGKILMDVAGHPLLTHVIQRTAAIGGVDQVVLAVPTHDVWQIADVLFRDPDCPIIQIIDGPEDDVLARYVIAARATEADVIVRVTGDCPLLDPEVGTAILRNLGIPPPADYTGNVNPRTFPDGCDVEAFTCRILLHADVKATDPSDREHVTPFMQRSSAVQGNYAVQPDRSAWRWTVDTAEDLAWVRQVMAEIPPGAYLMKHTIAAIEISGAGCRVGGMT